MQNHLIKEFVKYTLVGGLSTLVDWLTFYIVSLQLHFHYNLAFLLAFSLGTSTHYMLNKKYTFKRKAFDLKKQVPMYALAVGLSFSSSFFVMNTLVSLGHLHLMVSKVVTTALMLAVNYVIHKYISFNSSWEVSL